MLQIMISVNINSWHSLCVSCCLFLWLCALFQVCVNVGFVVEILIKMAASKNCFRFCGVNLEIHDGSGG